MVVALVGPGVEALVGFDQEPATEATRTSNRIRGLFTQFHPSLERVLGPRLDRPAVTWLLERYAPRPVQDLQQTHIFRRTRARWRRKSTGSR